LLLGEPGLFLLPVLELEGEESLDLFLDAGELEGEEYLDLLLLIPNRYLIRRLYCMRSRLDSGLLCRLECRSASMQYAEHWAEGNTNQAYRNLYAALDAKKLAIVKQLVQLYASNDDPVGWLENNIMIHLVGFRVDHEKRNDKIAVRKWDALNQSAAEPSPVVKQVSSLESVVLMLMRTTLPTLRKVLALQKKCIVHKNDTACSTMIKGGGNSSAIVASFLKIKPENAVIVKNIFKEFDDLESLPLKTNNIYKLTTTAAQHWKVDVKVFEYSDRTSVPDVWKTMCFLLAKTPEQLKAFHTK